MLLFIIEGKQYDINWSDADRDGEKVLLFSVQDDSIGSTVIWKGEELPETYSEPTQYADMVVGIVKDYLTTEHVSTGDVFEQIEDLIKLGLDDFVQALGGEITKL